ncbi:MAG TPA: LLM class flavin-dependent oxidoreductase [Pseudonocardia sp.]|jgi:alkanesulfonate monooxygenase SsuD/methylene tetrahydromethanopterin reductase-like flavin-dependent oxidoreductase (luciferase family)|nr:LLM class flavin-dependent oxidoreductase [Pseudonocardia sp.]
MHVGRGIFLQNRGQPERDGEVVATEFRLAGRAEADGFDSVWAAEHHFDGYHMCPSPVQALTWLAARTERVLLGSMVVVLPWYDPVRLAGELAMVDHLSGGRLLLGVGRGLGRIEFDGFRLPMAESRPRFVEHAEALVAGFETGTMAYDGEYYRQPPVQLRPRPHGSLRGRVYASAVSPASIDIMARLRFGVMVIPQKPWETTEAEIRAYRERFLEINGVEPPRPILATWVNVHESAARAHELHEENTVEYARSIVEHYEFANSGLAEIPGYEYYGALARNIAKHGVDRFTRFLADLQVHGTPGSVTDQLVDQARRIDAAGVIVVLSTFGHQGSAEAERNHDLFARSVLPRLHDVDAHRTLARPC